jgi:16S rRNA (cytosine967-C5)-methyltransferase
MPTDNRLCTEITYGTLRWYLRLKEFSERFLSRPDKLPDEMRLTLITALYEMAFLRVPHHGPVSWAVKHVGNRFGKGLSGVANGALRSMQRGLKDFHSPDLPPATRHAMPEWLIELWMTSYGEAATLALLEASQSVPPSGLRLNRAKPGWEKERDSLLRENADSARPVGSSALAFHAPLPWQARELIKEGRASRQSAASYEALEAFSPALWPQPVWDCCAGRGGKTLALLEQGISVALASDPSAHRLDSLGKEYARLGLSTPPCPTVLAVAADAVDENSAAALQSRLPDSFGAILVDAPCSGLGTLARRPEIRLRRTPEDLDTLAATQRRILKAVWPGLRSGGLLIYLTCTLNPAENQDQIAAFTATHPDAIHNGEFHTPFDSPLREFFYGAMLKKY